MSNYDAGASSAHRTSSGRPPADRAIAMLGCLSGAITLLVVTMVAAITSVGGVWLIAPPIGAILFALGAWWAWRLVALHGYFHDVGDEEDEEDEDGSPEGGSGVRYPPDAPDGGGSLEFDWDAFVTGFWDHVDAVGRDPALS